MGKSIKEALQEAVSFLKQRGIEGARLDAELLLALLLTVERPYLYAHAELELSAAQLEHYAALCRRRAEGEPLAYIRGEKEFMGLSFLVERGVFIPRPETEHLVEGVLQWLQTREGSPVAGKPLNMLELGAGSGCIAVSLALKLPQALLTAVDCDPQALALAHRNSVRHGVETRISFLQGHFFQALAAGEGRSSYHVIVSNPPYIEEDSLAQLSREVRQEPRCALCGGRDGLDAYREIIGEAEKYLLSPGLLALELGAGQAAQALALGRRAGFTEWHLIRDYAGIERVILFTV